VNQSLSADPIIQRSLGIVQLNDATYEEIEHDTSALPQAVIVVLVAGLAGGIGSIDDSVWGIIAGPIGALVGWAVASFFIYMVGTRLLPSTLTQADLGQVLRLYGYAAVPGVANVLGFIPVVGAIVALAAGIWGIVCAVKAIMHSLEMSIVRAIVTAIVASIVAAVVIGVVALIFSLPFWALTYN
jgi:hypothetical protein